MANRLPIQRKKFNSLIPLRYYYGTFKVMFKAHKYDLKISFDIDFLIQKKRDLDYLKSLNKNKEERKNRKNRNFFPILIEKRDILKHIDSNQPFSKDDFDINLETKNIKSRGESYYFKFSREQLLNFAGIDSTPSKITVFVNHKPIKVSFSINCKGSFVKVVHVKQYLDKNPRYMDFTILRNEFRINHKHFKDTDEEYLTNNHYQPTKKYYSSSLSDFFYLH